MAFTAKDYSKLIGMEGFSETLLKNHFTLYQGYVTNTNKVTDALATMLKEGKTATPEYAEMKASPSAWAERNRQSPSSPEGATYITSQAIVSSIR